MRGLSVVLVVACLAGCATDPYALPPPRTPNGVAGPGSPALHAEALRELQAMRSTTYAHKVHVDEDRGVFDYDCSAFVDYAIGNVAPDALGVLRAVHGVKRPNARTYVDLLASLAPGETRGRWTALARVADLRAGDVVAWVAVAKKKDYLGNVNSGHVMVVDGPPLARADGEWVVPVVDASSSGHGGSDARKHPDANGPEANGPEANGPAANGIGRGTIVIVTEEDAPVGYRWTESPDAKVVRTRVVLGRIL